MEKVIVTTTLFLIYSLALLGGDLLVGIIKFPTFKLDYYISLSSMLRYLIGGGCFTFAIYFFSARSKKESALFNFTGAFSVCSFVMATFLFAVTIYFKEIGVEETLHKYVYLIGSLNAILGIFCIYFFRLRKRA